MPDPVVITECAIVSLTNDYVGGSFPQGITTVRWIAVNEFVDSDTCVQIVIYEPTTLLTSYNILGIEKVTLMPNNNVASGSVGVTDANGEAYMQNHTTLISTGSFVMANTITTFPNTNIINAINAPAPVTLPVFEQNPTMGGPDITIPTNSTVTLTDTVFGQIILFKGARVIFSNPFGIVNAQTIRVNNKAAGSETVMQFSQCTKVRVKGRVEMGPRCEINPDSLDVIFFVEGANNSEKDNQPAADIGPNSTVYADFYVPNGRFYAHAGSNADPARYTGTYIARWITGDPDIIWNGNPKCDGFDCPAILAKTSSLSTNNNKDNKKSDEPNDDIMIKSYPNPFSDITTIEFSVPETGKVTLEVFNMSGVKVASLFNGIAESNKVYTIEFRAKEFPTGIYVNQLITETASLIRKLVIVK